MTLITIRETGKAQDSPNAAVIFDRQGDGYPVTIANPFSPEEEKRMEWYFEEHLLFPFTDTVRAGEAAAAVKTYGESLFAQIFGNNPKIYAHYRRAMDAGGASTISFEFLGSPEFHRLHWEALRDPDYPAPLAIEAPMVRSIPEPPVAALQARPSPTIHVLVVTARPGGRRDVGYRTISRPLVELLRRARLPVRVDILRPGSFGTLADHLRKTTERYGAGYYHVMHFDLHGAVLTYDQLKKAEGTETPLQFKILWHNRPGGREDLAAYTGEKAFLFFEGTEAAPMDPAEASEVAGLLVRHQVPIALLNACQSGKHVVGTEATESSLGSRLLQAGVKTVLAMSYSVTVTAAEIMMERLYRELFDGKDLSPAIRNARYALYDNRKRRACFNQHISLEDWVLPVVYQSGDGAACAALPLRKSTLDEDAAWNASLETRYRAPGTAYGFVGRDVDILEIEKMLLRPREGSRRNLLLIRGMGGAGKTTLLHHLGEWWQTTRFVEEVFYFGYDKEAWTLDRIMDSMAARLYGGETAPRGPGLAGPDGFMTFRAMNRAAQKQKLAGELRSRRHLLVLDNLESITGAHLAIRHTLPPDERERLRDFLADLVEGETLVLLGSRGGEGWLMEGASPPLRMSDVYELPGLDEEAASVLAERILERAVPDVRKRDDCRKEKAFGRLLKLLGGYPLPLEVVLANLSRQAPEKVVEALEAGDVHLDSKDTQSETEKHPPLHRLLPRQPGARSPEAPLLPGPFRRGGLERPAGALQRAVAGAAPPGGPALPGVGGGVEGSHELGAPGPSPGPWLPGAPARFPLLPALPPGRREEGAAPGYRNGIPAAL